MGKSYFETTKHNIFAKSIDDEERKQEITGPQK